MKWLFKPIFSPANLLLFLIAGLFLEPILAFILAAVGTAIICNTNDKHYHEPLPRSNS